MPDEGSLTVDYTKEIDANAMEPTTMMTKTKTKSDTVETKTATTTTQLEAFNISSPSLSLHDCLSLGEIELGLEKRYEACENIENNKNRRQRSIEEIRRLPYLLRTLSRIRPLASIQSFTKMKKSKSKTDDCHDDDDRATSGVKINNHEDDDIDRLVDCLEDVTAMHSVAEGIDVVTNHLAPSVAKSLSRLLPLVRKRKNGNIDNNEDSDTDYHRCWDTQELSAVARDPISKRRRLRNKNSTSSSNKYIMKDRLVGGRGDAGTAEDTLVATSSDDGYDDGEEDNTITMATDIEYDTVVDRGRYSRHRRDSMKVAAEDSQESTVIKTLSELASLVVASLEPSHLVVPNQEGHNHDHRNDVEGEGEENDQKRYPRKMTSTLVLNMDDSILSEKTTGKSCISSTDDRNTPMGLAGGGVMEGSDLCSTIVAILHHAPCLQSRHVANAFCRASIPLTPILMSQLGANCPASVQSLLLGCIEAYSMSIQYHYRLGDSNNYSRGYKGHNGKAVSSLCPVAAAAKSGVMALARLSQTESSRVRSKLQSLDVMLDVQIKLSIETKMNDIIPVACLLIEHLSFSKSGETAPAIPVDETTTEEQPGGDTNNNLASTYTMSCSENAEPSLLFHFVKNPDLYTQTLNYFSQTLKFGASSQSGSGINKCKGKWILILKAYNLLLLVPLTRPSCSGSTLRVYKSSVKAFVELVQNLDYVSDEGRPEMSDVDSLISLVLSCSVLILSRTLANTEERESEDKENVEFVRMMQSVFNICRSTSDRSNMIRLSFESEIKNEDHWGLFKNALYPLETSSYIDESYTRNSYRSMQIGLNRFCDIMQPVLGGDEGEVELNIAYKISTQLRVLRSCSESTDKYLVVVEETKELLDCLLKIDNEGEALSLIDNVESVQFVIEATRFLAQAKSSEVPLVLPAHLDMTWSEIASTWTLSDTETTDGRRCIYLFRFLYAFTFLNTAPKSPFAFDPRSSPIKESLSMIKMLSSKSTRDYLLSELQILIQKHCPELDFKQFEQELEFQVAPPFDTMNRKSLLGALSKSIQGNFGLDNAKICENNATEQLFLQAKSRVCDADVYCTIINAFLSSPHNPPPNYSYYVLCRDPIVCFKFPLCVWKCQSLRRIALSVLETLLRSNEAITLKESINNDSAFELLMARDAIVARCLLAALHGGDSTNLVVCSMTSTFIRWLIRCRCGLVALLVKQGLQDRDLDWLVENVPETMNDSRCMLQIFSERNYLTSAERLVAADAIIRIAIVHGQSNETESSQLILIAVSQLVDSFYLILGPIGLFPVDALFNADSDTPITQILQKAALRILKSLTRVRGTKTHNIRSEYSMVIQKFINLCKGELQSGVVTGRRKQLLKELYDAATKAEK